MYINFINKIRNTTVIALISMLLLFSRKCKAVDNEIIIGMRALVLSIHNPTSTLQSLKSYGIPYDLLIYNCKNQLKGNLYLYDEVTGNPKYNMIIIDNGRMQCNCNGNITDVLNKNHWEALGEYEEKYGVRRVSLNEIPNEEIGTSQNISINQGENIPIKFSDNSVTDNIVEYSGIQKTAPLSTIGLQCISGNIINSEISIPILYYDTKDSSKKEIAAVYSKLKNNSERLSFFFSNNSFTTTSKIINHLWIPWISKGLFNGYRRVFLNQHVDDIFDSVKIMDIPENIFMKNRIYRNTPDDFENIKNFQNEILKKMPEGSNYRLEFVFNGNGIFKAIKSSYYINEKKSDNAVSNDFVKPKDTGYSLWGYRNSTFYTSWLESELLKDDVYIYFRNKKNQEVFNWSSHGFTHENLNNVTKSDVINEIRANMAMAKRLGFFNQKNWSRHSIITPNASGLHSSDAIDAFKANGIRSASGNIIRKDITDNSLNGKYLPWYTTLESSGVEGFPVIPRIPTIFFKMCSTLSESIAIYNKINEGTGLEGVSFEKMLEKESDRVLQHLLDLYHNPYQFHQANIRSTGLHEKNSNGGSGSGSDSNGKSLLQVWTEKLVEKYTQYVKWPISSLKLDDLHQTFIENKALKHCGLDYYLKNNRTHITEIEIYSKYACKVPVTLPKGVSIEISNSKSSQNNNTASNNESNFVNYEFTFEKEKSKDDYPIVWIILHKNGHQSLKFSPAISWNVNIESNEDLSNQENINKTTEATLNNEDNIITASSTLSNLGESKYKSIPHDVISNIIKNVLNYRAEVNRAVESGILTNKQLQNQNSLIELAKSSKINESQQSQHTHEDSKQDKISSFINNQKENYLNKIQEIIDNY